MFVIEHCGAYADKNVELIKINKNCENVLVLSIQERLGNE